MTTEETFFRGKNLVRIIVLRNRIKRHPVQPNDQVIKSYLKTQQWNSFRLGRRWNTAAADSTESSRRCRDFSNNPFTSRNCTPLRPQRAQTYTHTHIHTYIHTYADQPSPAHIKPLLPEINLFHCQCLKINNKQRKQTGNKTPKTENKKPKSKK